MIQLRRNNLNMTNAALSQDWGTFHIYTWVNNSKTTFGMIFSMLNWQAAEMSAVVVTWNSSNHNYAYPCLLDSSCFKIWPQLGIYALCLFRVIFTSNLSGLVFPWCNNFNNIFSHVMQFTNSFTGFSLFSIIIRGA